MRRLLAALALIATPAYADGFTEREVAFQVLNAMDGAQTCHAVSSGRGVEGNPMARLIIGRTPSCGKVIGLKVASGLIHYLVADHLRDRDPHAAKVFQVMSLVVQGGVVAANMRFVF